MKRDNTAKKRIVRWQFRGDELFHVQLATGTARGALPP